MKPDPFWHVFYAWSLGLGFVLTVILIIMVWTQWYNNDLPNPFGPFIRAFERRQALNHKIRMMQAKASLIHNGLDADYVEYLEKNLDEERERDDTNRI